MSATDTPRTLLAAYLRTKLDRRRTLLLDTPAGFDNLGPGVHGIVLTTATITPAPNRTGVRRYEMDVWAVSPHVDVVQALPGLELQAEQLLQLLDQAPFEAVWQSVEYSQFADDFHAYRITVVTHLEVTYS